MLTQISGKNIDMGDALRGHVEASLAAAVEKYAERAVDSAVVFSRDGHEFKADLAVNLPTGMTVKAKGRATDIYAAFDGAADRIEKQLRRYKRRLKDHHKTRPEPILAMEAAAYVLAGEDADNVEEPETLQPVVVAEMKAEIPSLSVGEAVMQMELADASFLLFRHEKEGRLNIVHRRDDGNIGWIDPQDLA